MFQKSLPAIGAALMLAGCCSAHCEPAPAECRQYRTDIQAVLPEFADFGTMTGRRVQLLAKDGKPVGALLLAPSGKRRRLEGYNDVINTAVVVNAENRIAGVVLGDNAETPRFLQRLRKAGYLTRWNGRTPAEAAKQKVDAVTRCTYSSKAIKSEVDAILDAHK